MQRIIVIVGMILLIGVSLCLAQTEETITLTTYYPSPYGEYGELGVDRDLSNNSDTITGLSVDIDESGTNAGTVTGLNVDVSGVTSGTVYAATFQGGSIGMGTASPNSPGLHIVSSGSGADLFIESDSDNSSNIVLNSPSKYTYLEFEEAGTSKWFVGNNYSDDSFRFSTVSVFNDTKLTIVQDGNVGIGTMAPDTKLEVATTDSASGLSNAGTLRLSSGAPQIDFVDSDNNDWAIHVNSNRLYFIRDAWNFTDLVLDGGGNVGIGTASPSVKLDIIGRARISNLPAGGAYLAAVDASGYFYRGPASSQRYKKDISDLEINPEDVLKLRPVRFKWKENEQEDIGLIAEEVDKLIKEIVVYDEQGRPDAVRFDKLSVYLLEMIKIQQQKIEELEKRLSALELRNGSA